LTYVLRHYLASYTIDVSGLRKNPRFTEIPLRKFSNAFLKLMAKIYKCGDVGELHHLCKALGENRKPLSMEEMKKSITNLLGSHCRMVARYDRSLFNVLVKHYLQI
jgi:hypothetical protein